MQRSEVNGLIPDAMRFCDRHGFRLPAWAGWSPARWGAAGPEADEIRRAMLGWDVTDFGSGDFNSIGLLLFTMRNGISADANQPDAKTYCEKMLLVGEGQVTPMHFHWFKMEDIINRGGGQLVLELWLADRKTEQPIHEGSLCVSVDGISREVSAGGKVVLAPGESITLKPYVYHRFYAEPGSGRVLAGEVSRVNDDATDNRFFEELPRFSPIEEDEPADYLLCHEYPVARKQV